MCPQYIRPPIVIDQVEVFQRYVDEMQARNPGWTYDPAEPDAWVGEALSFIAAELGEHLSEQLDADFRYFLANMASVPPVDAASATGTVTFTLTDTTAHTIPAGTVLAARDGDDLVGFETVADASNTVGVASIAGVGVIAREPGTAANGLTGLGVMVDALAYVDTVTFTDTTAGGTEAEGDDDYLDRGRTKLQLSTDTPILPAEFAALANDVAGVGRAIAVDGYDPAVNSATYDPDDMGTWEPGAVAVAAIDPDGNAAGAGVKTAIDTYLQSTREVGFMVSVIDPTFTTIDVAFTFTTWNGYDSADVQAAAVAAVEDYLAAANWGSPPFDDPTEWEQDNLVRHSEVMTVLNGVDGLKHVTALTLAGGTDSGDDQILAGVVSLPTAGSIVGSPA